MNADGLAMTSYFGERQRVPGGFFADAQLEVFARGMPAKLAKSLKVKAGSPTLTMVRRYYGQREELFEVTVTTHPEGRYTYTMDMQRSLRPRV